MVLDAALEAAPVALAVGLPVMPIELSRLLTPPELVAALDNELSTDETAEPVCPDAMLDTSAEFDGPTPLEIRDEAMDAVSTVDPPAPEATGDDGTCA
jgi:hypothetical protein